MCFFYNYVVCALRNQARSGKCREVSLLEILKTQIVNPSAEILGAGKKYIHINSSTLKYILGEYSAQRNPFWFFLTVGLV